MCSTSAAHNLHPWLLLISKSLCSTKRCMTGGHTRVQLLSTKSPPAHPFGWRTNPSAERIFGFTGERILDFSNCGWQSEIICTSRWLQICTRTKKNISAPSHQATACSVATAVIFPSIRALTQELRLIFQQLSSHSDGWASSTAVAGAAGGLRGVVARRRGRHLFAAVGITCKCAHARTHTHTHTHTSERADKKHRHIHIHRHRP